MAKPAGTDPLGGAEVAELLGVKRGTVRIWQYRGHFPAPDWAAVNGLPAWRRSTVLRWAERTGRIPASLNASESERVEGDPYAETEPGRAGVG